MLSKFARFQLGFVAVTALTCAALISAPAAHATTVSEGSGILNTYTGPTVAGDLDAKSASATFDSKDIFLTATMFDKIGTTDKGIYIWGVDRGKGTALLADPKLKDPGAGLTHADPPIGQHVTFDAFIKLDNKGKATVFLIKDDQHLESAPVDLPAGSVSIHDDTISVAVPISLLPSTGFDVADYGYNIWPRFDSIAENTLVTDFLPDDRDFQASFVPEPGTSALMLSGLGLLGLTVRRRRAEHA